MDTDAQRSARRRAIKADLAEAYDDDEASPPEWVDLLERSRRERSAIADGVVEATDAFSQEPDIRRALADREGFATATRERINHFNKIVARLNLLAPHPRFTRMGLDPEETLRPLFRTRRAAGKPD